MSFGASKKISGIVKSTLLPTRAAGYAVVCRAWRYGQMIAVLLACSVASAGTIRQPSGYYVMQGVHSQTVKDSMLATPSLAGIHIRDEWALVQPTSSGYSFAWIDGQVSRAAKLGKQVTLGIYAGQN